MPDPRERGEAESRALTVAVARVVRGGGPGHLGTFAKCGVPRRELGLLLRRSCNISYPLGDRGHHLLRPDGDRRVPVWQFNRFLLAQFWNEC